MTYTETNEIILEAVIEAGFSPTDDLLELSARAESVLNYYTERGFEAFRLEADGYTLVRWSEDGITVLSIDPNGVESAEARFTYNARGAAWLAAVIA